MIQKPDNTEGFAYPPCCAHELSANGYVVADQTRATVVARWRKFERERLIEKRFPENLES